MNFIVLKESKFKKIKTKPILQYLAARQGSLTSIWYGDFVGRENDIHMGRKIGKVADIYLAFPKYTLTKTALSKMRRLGRRGLVNGCFCGCRGDFYITEQGLVELEKLKSVI